MPVQAIEKNLLATWASLATVAQVTHIEYKKNEQTSAHNTFYSLLLEVGGWYGRLHEPNRAFPWAPVTAWNGGQTTTTSSA